MRFFKSFRLLHRRTRSEGDVSHMISSPPSSTGSPCSMESRQIQQYVRPTSSSLVSGSAAPVFVSLEASLPSFDPAQLYQPRPTPLDMSTGNCIHQPESDVFRLRQTNTELAADLADVTNDLSRTRNELYTEMTKLARFQHQLARGMDHIQKLESRFQRLAGLLVDIGIPYFTVQRISDALDSDLGTADHILVNAIGDAVHDSEALLSSLKPAVIGNAVLEQYQSALHMTLSARRKVCAQKKVSKFWKRLAQEDDRHTDTVTPSSSNISSVREPLTPARQHAVDSLIARRRDANAGFARYAFSGASVQGGLVLPVSTSDIGSAASSASGSTIQLQHTSPSRARFSISELRRRSPPMVLGDIDLNVSQSSDGPPEAAEPDDSEHDGSDDQNARPTVTLSQDLIQNLNLVALGRGHRRNSSAVSRSSIPSRLSDSTPAVSSLSASSGLPTSSCGFSSDVPFDNSAFHSLLYGIGSTPTNSDRRKCSNTLISTRRNSRFLEHINEYSTGSLAILESADSLGLMNSTGSLAVLNTTASTIVTSPGLFGTSRESKDSLFMSTQTPTTGPTTPSKTPPTESRTPSSSGSKLPVLRHLHSPDASPDAFKVSIRNPGGIIRRLSPSPESFVRKLRNFGSRDGSENVSPEKPSGIPIMQRKMTIRGRVRM
ncbi:uncharacterized protein F5891DRAFT_36091 [Suillus fuscotomentosus]|uniref:Uncharacterized protein n=1 Tax=Suillus fuscotomentosus TaxID=1912939 RepID=A0AAD4HNH8_9AGAM|nr:uncharacterized protein F5891DRAFT_36091 [Suillus fuscotomentosus]KAG1904245.1 hypothetical protein F5891DRAFT_36091 [Suillus fuscotomentosus]